MPVDYRRYYDLEDYLFDDVSQRFRADGSIGAFDFFSIVIWKANRAKSVTARRLLSHAAPGESLDALCHRLTAELYRATDPKARFFVLTGPPWKFALPMASAILAVLYPETFTVYDYRVCEELRAFENLTNLTDRSCLWSGYSEFVAAVQASCAEPDLRNKDRYLIGRSLATQLARDLQSWSEMPAVPST